MITDDKIILARLLDLESRMSKLESGVHDQLQSTISTPPRKQSLREFLSEKEPRTTNDKALCIAYYLETSKGFESFNAEDIKNGFREARIPVPSNPNDVVNKNIIKGYVMDAEALKESKKAWMLTTTGIALIQKGFAGK